MSKPDGGPAFPGDSKIGSPFTRSGSDQNGGWSETITEITVQSGMSLRDWFAGQALVGMYPHARAITRPGEEASPIWARMAYAIADAMLAERAKGE